jgi:hypothetical protein
VTEVTVAQAIDEIYSSLHNENVDLDLHIAGLKQALQTAGQKQAVFAPSRLAQNNRQGRKMMQAYFRKRGVAVIFEEAGNSSPNPI